MKFREFIVCSVLLFLATMSYADEIVITGSIINISNDSPMDDPFGGEVQYRHNIGKIKEVPIAVGFSLGMIDSEVRDNHAGFERFLWWRIPWSMDGSIIDIPIGISAITKVPLGPKMDIVAQAGAKYHIMTDHLTYKLGPLKANPTIDDSTTLNFGLALEQKLTKTVSAFIGAEYQYDLSENYVAINGNRLFKHDLTGFAFRAGGVIKFN